MTTFNRSNVSSDSSKLITDFYPIAPGVELRMHFLFKDGTEEMDYILECSPAHIVLDPQTKVDPELWQKAIASMKAQFDEHTERYGIPNSSKGPF